MRILFQIKFSANTWAYLWCLPSPGGYTVDLSDWATDDWSVPEGGVKYCKHLARQIIAMYLPPPFQKTRKKSTNRYQTPASNMPILGSYIQISGGGGKLIWFGCADAVSNADAEIEESGSCARGWTMNVSPLIIFALKNKESRNPINGVKYYHVSNMFLIQF